MKKPSKVAIADQSSQASNIPSLPHGRRGKPWSLERRANTKRFNKARYLWRTQPLFAFSLMQKSYPSYTEAEFRNDLTYHPKRTEAGGEFHARFGRYQKIQSLLKQFKDTGDFKYILAANKLRERINKPYIIRLIKGKEVKEYLASPQLAYSSIESFVKKAKACATWEDCDALFKELVRYAEAK